NTKLNYENLKTIKHSHIATTVQYARAIGKSLGMSPDELQTMEIGAALHDIGKTLIPAEILNKQGQLTPEERRIVNYHSILGYEILKSTGKNVNVAEIARDHHNPFSKNKYAQIVRAADVYSAMTEKRSYKEAKSHDEAMKVLKSMNINPQILDALENEYGKNNPKNQETSTLLAPV
ncbi:MAG: HD domain-containing protein, partial [Bacteroidaceae bacterium]|nr:HD domain-containing protein [Bacteroidaceae bacterium]